MKEETRICKIITKEMKQKTQYTSFTVSHPLSQNHCLSMYYVCVNRVLAKLRERISPRLCVIKH